MNFFHEVGKLLPTVLWKMDNAPNWITQVRSFLSRVLKVSWFYSVAYKKFVREKLKTELLNKKERAIDGFDTQPFLMAHNAETKKWLLKKRLNSEIYKKTSCKHEAKSVKVKSSLKIWKT